MYAIIKLVEEIERTQKEIEIIAEIEKTQRNLQHLTEKGTETMWRTKKPKRMKKKVVTSASENIDLDENTLVEEAERVQRELEEINLQLEMKRTQKELEKLNKRKR